MPGKQAPKYLSREAGAWWRSVLRDYELDPHHEMLLSEAAACWDRIGEARAILDRDGLTTIDRYQQVKAHPMLDAEHKQRIAFARLIRELALDDGVVPADPRLPRR